MGLYEMIIRVHADVDQNIHNSMNMADADQIHEPHNEHESLS